MPRCLSRQSAHGVLLSCGQKQWIWAYWACSSQAGAQQRGIGSSIAAQQEGKACLGQLDDIKSQQVSNKSHWKSLTGQVSVGRGGEQLSESQRFKAKGAMAAVVAGKVRRQRRAEENAFKVLFKWKFTNWSSNQQISSENYRSPQSYHML